MATSVNNGTTVGISATLPATYDAAGYAVPVITDLGEAVDIGEIAKAFAMVNHQALANDYPTKHKDTYDISDVSITFGRDTSDAGQVILQTALASDASFTFKVLLPSTDTAFFTAKVTKAGLGAISSGSVSSTVVTLAIDPQTLYEG